MISVEQRPQLDRRPPGTSTLTGFVLLISNEFLWPSQDLQSTLLSYATSPATRSPPSPNSTCYDTERNFNCLDNHMRKDLPVQDINAPKNGFYS